MSVIRRIQLWIWWPTWLGMDQNEARAFHNLSLLCEGKDLVSINCQNEEWDFGLENFN